jgi:hypothetical protein
LPVVAHARLKQRRKGKRLSPFTSHSIYLNCKCKSAQMLMCIPLNVMYIVLCTSSNKNLANPCNLQRRRCVHYTDGYCLRNESS